MIQLKSGVSKLNQPGDFLYIHPFTTEAHVSDSEIIFKLKPRNASSDHKVLEELNLE